jgi:amidase
VTEPPLRAPAADRPGFHHRSALDIASTLRRGEATASEVVEHFLDRVATYDERVGGFVTVTADRARMGAAAADRRLSAGGRLPVLFGVPTAIKDLASTAGVRTMFGSTVTARFVPAVSDAVVDKITDAGLISMGKTNTPEFGCPCYTESDVAPPARTPYDLRRGAGGSSGGAATAVAAGLVPVAHGSDGGGSIRIPASSCGLVGFKPSRGRITRAPVYGDVTGLSTPGAIARTVRDAAAFLDAMTGPAPGDALWAAPPPDGAPYLEWCDRDPGRLRIGRFPTPLIAAVEVDPEVLTGYEQLSTVLAGLGHDVVDVDVPFPHDVVEQFEVVWAVSAAMWPVDPRREHELRPLTRWLRSRAERVSGAAFGAALVALQQAAANALTALAPYDLVLTPTLAQLPAPVGGIRDDADPAADFEAQKAFTPYTSAWNVTGSPAVSVPSCWSRERLPIGMMLAGRPGDDHTVFSAAAQLEAVVDKSGNWNRPVLTAFG